MKSDIINDLMKIPDVKGDEMIYIYIFHIMRNEMMTLVSLV